LGICSNANHGRSQKGVNFTHGEKIKWLEKEKLREKRRMEKIQSPRRGALWNRLTVKDRLKIQQMDGLKWSIIYEIHRGQRYIFFDIYATN
jgi:hypothetical protein